MKNHDAEVQAYIDAIPPGRKERFEKLVETIKRLYPEVEESMQYRMPTYRHGNGWVAAANQKQYLSLYTCSAEHIARFKYGNPAIKTGKGCINFRDNDDIPIADTEQVIVSALENSGHA